MNNCQACKSALKGLVYSYESLKLNSRRRALLHSLFFLLKLYYIQLLYLTSLGLIRRLMQYSNTTPVSLDKKYADKKKYDSCQNRVLYIQVKREKMKILNDIILRIIRVR